MSKNGQKPVNMQAKREQRAADLAATPATPTGADTSAADEELAAAMAKPTGVDEDEQKDTQEAMAMGAVQVSMEEVFQIIGAQEYELRALRQRVPILAQQVVTLKGVIRKLEAAAKK
jgi:hypothetical protein